MSSNEPSQDGGTNTFLRRSRSSKLFKHPRVLDAHHHGLDFADTSLAWDSSCVSEIGDTALALYDRTSSVSSSLSTQHFGSRFGAFGCPVTPALEFNSKIGRLTADDASSTSSLYELNDHRSSAYSPFDTLPACADRLSYTSDSIRFGIRRRQPSIVHKKGTPERRSIAGADQESQPNICEITKPTERDVDQDINAVGQSCAVLAVEPLKDNFNCPHCTKVFATRSTLRHHVICHDPVKAHKHHCTKCQRGFRYPKDLKRHSLVHRRTHKAGGHPEDLACPVCHKLFSRRDNLGRHQRLSSHSGNQAPEGNSSSRDQTRQSSGARGTDTQNKSPEEPAQAHDPDYSIPQSQSGSGNKPVVPAWPSQLTLPTRPTRKRSFGKRTQRPSSDEEDGSDEDHRKYKRQRPVRRRYYLVCPFHDCQKSFPDGISTLLRHLKDLHLVNICDGCLKRGICQTSQACKKICAWRACRYRPQGSNPLFHERTIDCTSKRNEDVRKTKYLLICQELGLVPKAITEDPKPRCLDCTANDEELHRLQQNCVAKDEEIAQLLQQLSIWIAIALQPTSTPQFSEATDLGHQGDASFSRSDVASSNDLPPWYELQHIPPGPAEDPQNQAESVSMLAPPDVGIPWDIASSQINDRGSFTQPSFQVSSQMHTSQYGTQTEPTELPDDGDTDIDTPILSNMDEFIDYNPHGSDPVLEGVGRHFDKGANGTAYYSRSRS